MKTADQILIEGGNLYAERNKIYGNNYMRTGRMLAAVFPEGITLKTEEDFARFHLMSMFVAKTGRYSNNFHNGGHQDSLDDIMVYAAILNEVDQNEKEKPTAK